MARASTTIFLVVLIFSFCVAAISAQDNFLERFKPYVEKMKEISNEEGGRPLEFNLPEDDFEVELPDDIFTVIPFSLT